MIDSNNHNPTNNEFDMDFSTSISLLYSCPILDTFFSPPNQPDYYDNFANKSNLNNVTNLNYNETSPSEINVNDSSYCNYIGDNYDLTTLTNRMVESSPTTQIAQTTLPSNMLTSSLSPSEHQHNYDCSTVHELDSRSIDGCKRDLIKATLNFAIKSRRRSLGLNEIELNQVKNQDEPQAPYSWTDEDDEKKMSRRERNRIAARKCRKKRKLKFISLNKTMESLDSLNTSLKEQLNKFKRESEQLEDLLTSHQCFLASQPMLNYSGLSQSLSPSISSLLSLHLHQPQR